MACINVHWMTRDATNGAFCFHMKHLENYVLDVNGLKAVDLAVKNILDYGLNERLAKIWGELNISGKWFWRPILYQRSGDHRKEKIPTRSQIGDSRRE